MLLQLSAFFSSFALVGLGEIGDKTQLLALALVCRFRRPWLILAAITAATLINHGLSVWLGEWITTLIPSSYLQWGIAASFILLGIWMLIPDQDSEINDTGHYGVFFTAFTLFFLAEIGDKTQIATIALAGHYHQFTAVLLGTTLGMIAANAPVLWFGERIRNTKWETRAHRLSAALFIGLGLYLVLI